MENHRADVSELLSVCQSNVVCQSGSNACTIIAVFWLSKHNARTLLELIREIGLSYTPSVNAIILTLMHDVQQWIENAAACDLSCHVHQHQFKIDLCADVKAKLSYKKWYTCPSLSPEGKKNLSC